MSHPVIPVPVRSDSTGGQFTFSPGTAVVCTYRDFVPIVERFCADIKRRTGLHLEVMAGGPGRGRPAVHVELAAGELPSLRVPLGVSPSGDVPLDERYSLAVDPDEVVLRAAEPVGVARGLTTLTQLLAAAASTEAATIAVGGAQILDAPWYRWRGLSLDLARTFFPLDEVHRVVDLLALYKLNVLHLHLTDDQGWRLPVGAGAGRRRTDPGFYSPGDLRALVAYAEDRFVTIVPEVDTPGHSAALVQMHPELATGRNRVEFELPPGTKHEAVWLDPDLPATLELVQEVLGAVAAIFPGPYIHIGGDEPRGMPHDLYASYVGWARESVRAIGKRPLGWQESARAGLGRDDIIQYWFTDIALPASLPPQVRAELDADLELSRKDIEAAVAASVPVIVSPLSHCYFDVPYAEPSAGPAQAERQGRLGLRLYSPVTVAGSFDWAPALVLGPGRAGQVAGVEAAIWCETVTDFDDLTFLLLPRLAGAAQKAWGGPRRPPGPTTVAAWLDTAGCGCKTISPISALRRWTGYRRAVLAHCVAAATVGKMWSWPTFSKSPVVAAMSLAGLCKWAMAKSMPFL